MDKSENSIFPKVSVSIDSKQKEYSPIYNRFDFNKKTKIVFTCYVCGAKKHELLGKPGNLLKHLIIHQSDSKLWIEAFDKSKNENKSALKITFDKKTITLV